MGYFAFEGGVTTGNSDGGVSITASEYAAAIEGMANGKTVTIAGGFAVVAPPVAKHWASTETGLYLGFRIEQLEGSTEVPSAPEDIRQIFADGAWQPVVPEISDYQAAIQSLIDSTARERNYDSGNSCVSYVGDPNAVYDAEAVAFRNWRSAVWTYAYGELAKVQAGERTQPTIETFLAELPTIDWP